MQLLIINGPNLNKLGNREPGIYGHETAEEIVNDLRKAFPETQFDYFQSNIEGELIDKLQQADGNYIGIILNPGGYSHTSVAISDALAALKTPVVEVHLSNLYQREEYRHVSLTGKNCVGVITGFGSVSYRLAASYFLGRNS